MAPFFAPSHASWPASAALTFFQSASVTDSGASRPRTRPKSPSRSAATTSRRSGFTFGPSSGRAPSGSGRASGADSSAAAAVAPAGSEERNFSAPAGS